MARKSKETVRLPANWSWQEDYKNLPDTDVSFVNLLGVAERFYFQELDALFEDFIGETK